MAEDSPPDTLYWHALNYRTAYSVHAEEMWQELSRFVDNCVQQEQAKSANLRAALEMIAAQGSGTPGSTSRVDCMAAIAAAAIRAT